jgi:ribosomal protein L33
MSTYKNAKTVEKKLKLKKLGTLCELGGETAG